MYPEDLVAPMRTELTSTGFEELKTTEDVSSLMDKENDSVFVLINSVCGCAAGNARPAAIFSVKQSEKKPGKVVTVFAGVDKEATEKMREYCLPYPPSSPSMALFRKGELVHFIERHHIEGNSPQAIADNLLAAFNEYL